MKYSKFIEEAKRIEEEAFGSTDGFGRLTRVDLEKDHTCFLVLNLNPNSGVKNNGSKQDLLESPLIFVPQCYDNDRYNGKLASIRGNKCRKPEKQNQTSEFWDDYRHPYSLFDAQKIKMFWAVGDNYKRDIAEKYPECKDEFESFYSEESKKPNNILVFSDFFHICQTDSKKIKPQGGVRELLDLYIDYYKPKLLLITNFALRNLIIKHLDEKDIKERTFYKKDSASLSRIVYKDTEILFSPMMWGKARGRYDWLKCEDFLSSSITNKIRSLDDRS